MKKLMLALLLVVAGPWGAAGQRPEDRPALRRPPAMRPGAGARRQMLQQRIFDRFMDRASVRLGLNPADRQRLQQVLLTNEAHRRQLAQQARALRLELMRAPRDSSTSDAEYERMLRQMGDLRARELDLWREEQSQLSHVLSPRQRVQLMAMRLEFAEMVQRARQGAGRAPLADSGPPSPP